MHPSPNEIEALERPELLALWAELMPAPPPKSLSTPFLRRFLAFELQARQFGGLPKSFPKSLEAARTKSRAPSAPALRPGARLLREWNGVTHVVDVTEDTFTWNGEQHRSLSSIARAITGAHWSGPRFFGLNGNSS